MTDDDIDDAMTDNWSVKRIARFFDLDRAVITRMLAKGVIKGAHRIGRTWRVPRENVLAYRQELQEREQRVLKQIRRG